ncbi:MAG: DNA/RNA helicase domain-containing protein [Candidatus Nomurabacteria bacterium]
MKENPNKKEEDISLSHMSFDDKGFDQLKNTDFGVNWPVVYLISGKEEMYVGQTHSAISRLVTHFKNEQRNSLKDFYIVYDTEANKSVVLDIESLLIRYLSADGKYFLQNKNEGEVDHNYFDKDRRESKIRIIWDKLKEFKLVTQDLMELKNSDLFKYSPYTALTQDQINIADSIFENIKIEKEKSFIVNGGAGTGKTILALYLIKMLKEKESTKDYKIGLVVSMTSLRKTLKKVVRNIKSLKKVNVIGPSDVSNESYDILVIDESHRLRTRKNNSNMKAFDDTNIKLGLDINKGTQLHWIMEKSKYQIFFYDKDQSVTPSDIGHDLFKEIVKDPIIYKLSTQLRVQGGEEYISNIKKLFSNEIFKIKDFKNYEFKIFDNLDEMINLIKKKDREFGICRMFAGYAWEWKSKKDISKFDIEIDNLSLRWNSTNDNWIYSKNAINEIGCIHTVQGYDLNYAGVIIGPELSYDFENKKLIVKKELYKDINGKRSLDSYGELLNYVLNIYKVLLTRAIKGTYVYICDENLRKYITEEFSKEIKKENFVKKNDYKNIISPYLIKDFITRNVELYDSIGCGDTRTADSVPTDTLLVKDDLMYKGRKYFVLRTNGDSMNKKNINDGDLVLCRKDYHPVDGNIVVALMGDDAILKEYRTKGGNVILKPNSTNSRHKDIVITPYDEEVKIQGIFVKVLKKGEDYKEN